MRRPITSGYPPIRSAGQVKRPIPGTRRRPLPGRRTRYDDHGCATSKPRARPWPSRDPVLHGHDSPGGRARIPLRRQACGRARIHPLFAGLRRPRHGDPVAQEKLNDAARRIRAVGLCVTPGRVAPAPGVRACGRRPLLDHGRAAGRPIGPDAVCRRFHDRLHQRTRRNGVAIQHLLRNGLAVRGHDDPISCPLDNQTRNGRCGHMSDAPRLCGARRHRRQR